MNTQTFFSLALVVSTATTNNVDCSGGVCTATAANAACAPEQQYPYYFFGAELQGMVHGGASVGDKPAGYYRPVRVSGAGAGTQ